MRLLVVAPAVGIAVLFVLAAVRRRHVRALDFREANGLAAARAVTSRPEKVDVRPEAPQ